VQVEEGDDAAAGVHGGFFVVADCFEAQHLKEAVAAMVVHEGVAGVGVLLYVVGDEGAVKGRRQLIGYALFPRGQAAIAADDWAGGVEEIFDILGKRAAVVDAGSREAVAGGEKQGEAATHAEADDTDAAITTWLGEEPASGGFDVVEGGACAGGEVADDLADADQAAAFVIEVRGNGEKAGLGEPVGLIAVVLAHAKDIVEDDDAGFRRCG